MAGTRHLADAVPATASWSPSRSTLAEILLSEAKVLFARSGRDDDFCDHMAAVPDAHHAKWALRQELDWAHLP